MSNLQAKQNLLEQTIRLEEEERVREDDERRKDRQEKEKEEQVQATAADRINSQLILQKEEAQRQRLLEEVKNDPAVPRSVLKLLSEQNGN